jgi:hypothetical protein
LPSGGAASTRAIDMEERTIQIGNKVSMGHTVYTVVSAPREGIFRAKDDAGKETTLAEKEVVLLKSHPQEYPQ